MHQEQLAEPLQIREGLTPDARIYAATELARRAGVAREFFRTWKIESYPTHTVVTLDANARKVVFEHAPEKAFAFLAKGRFPVARARWFTTPEDDLLREDLVVPFVESPGDSLPLFHRGEDGNFACKLDVLLSVLFTLSRFEESTQRVLDAHNRFPASASLAKQHEFLERPVVDELGLAFGQIIKALLPAWDPLRPPLRVKLTHDIDSVGIPFNLRTTIGHTLKRSRPSATIRDFVSCFTTAESAELALVRLLARISKDRGIRSAFFWKASPPGPFDSGYSPSHPKVRRVIANLHAQGFELGVHPGYQTFGDRSRLSQEVEALRRTLGNGPLGGRQHYLRWKPQTWLDWESCGLAYDSTLGFADAIGFRAGTCVPFRPWSIEQNRELDLIEIPLLVMDCTLVKYMGLPKREGLARVQECVKRAALAGGVFTLLWHNTPLIEPEYDGWYEAVLDLIPANTQSFSLPSTPADLW